MSAEGTQSITMHAELTFPSDLIPLIQAYTRLPEHRRSSVLAQLHQAIPTIDQTPKPPTICLSDYDQAIAAAIDKYEPASAKEIVKRCQKTAPYIGEQAVRDRMRKTLPLRRLGYRYSRSRSGYVSPSYPYRPHPADALIIAAIQLEGGQTYSQLITCLEAETCRIGGEMRPLNPTTIQRRISEMAAGRLLGKFGSVYVIGDIEKVAQLEAIDFGER